MITEETNDKPKKIMSGLKNDGEKVRWELVPPDAVNEVAKVLTFGAHKYADRNWEKGMEWSRVYGALQRHMAAWWGGEDTDSETGLSHLAHAGCCIMFLLSYEKRNVGLDDRHKLMSELETLMETTVKQEEES